jgi:GTP cyclohydrolase I
LTDNLHQLQVQQQTAQDDVTQQSAIPRTIHSRDDYGFRRSGLSTPLLGPSQLALNGRSRGLVPDPNGLGWPGESAACILTLGF